MRELWDIIYQYKRMNKKLQKISYRESCEVNGSEITATGEVVPQITDEKTVNTEGETKTTSEENT